MSVTSSQSWTRMSRFITSISTIFIGKLLADHLKQRPPAAYF
jgi:hypothetical protein